jgi:NAD-dependent deacetylase
MSSELDKVVELVRTSEYILALTGAGISKESNVPTFRGEDGLWRNYDPMELATPQAFEKNPKLVWEWYSWRQNLIRECRPNPAHMVLASWEENGLLKSIITQNVDGLHRRAGSQRVLEIHGNIWRVRCTSCSFSSTLEEPAGGVPLCPECNELLRPDVVWFGESLDAGLMNKAYTELGKSELLFVIGTSAMVQPAASFPMIVKQNHGKLIEINPDTTPLSEYVDIRLGGRAGEILPEIDKILKMPSSA